MFLHSRARTPARPQQLPQPYPDPRTTMHPHPAAAAAASRSTFALHYSPHLFHDPRQHPTHAPAMQLQAPYHIPMITMPFVRAQSSRSPHAGSSCSRRTMIDDDLSDLARRARSVRSSIGCSLACALAGSLGRKITNYYFSRTQ